MSVENAERNKYLRMTDEEILKAIDDAVYFHDRDGYTQRCEAEKCPHCDKYTWKENDVFDYIASSLRILYNEKYAADETDSESESESKTETETAVHCAVDFDTFIKSID
jgi:hypothetical protein